jgi:hypothetical protein
VKVQRVKVSFCTPQSTEGLIIRLYPKYIQNVTITREKIYQKSKLVNHQLLLGQLFLIVIACYMAFMHILIQGGSTYGTVGIVVKPLLNALLMKHMRTR